MSAEVETTVTRPNIFPECRNCPIATGKIISWLTFIPFIPHVSVETTKIKISCSIENRQVTLLNENELKIQFVEGRPVLSIPAGNMMPELVNCPHFFKKRAPK